MTSYREFLKRKAQHNTGDGFTPDSLPSHLFGFQADLVGWALQQGRAAVFADCGLGKSPMSLAWAEQIHQRSGRPVLIVCPLAVSFQMLTEAVKFGVDAAVSRDGRVAAPVTITNYERLELFDPADFGGGVCDECFPAGTLIDTPDGQKRIEDFIPGDRVTSAVGADTVHSVHNREVSHAVEVRFAGQAIICSANHPWLTTTGWVPASALGPGDALVTAAEALRLVRDELREEDAADASASELLRAVLLSEVADERPRTGSAATHPEVQGTARRDVSSMACGRVTGGGGSARAYSAAEPDGGPRDASEGVTDAEGSGPRTPGAWRQRTRDDGAAVRPVGSVGRRLGSRTHRVAQAATSGIPVALQAGRGQHDVAHRDRSGRPFTPIPQAARREEGRDADVTRVDSVEVLELGDPRLARFRDASGALRFYDLGVARHPSFVVAGQLVHNSSAIKSFDGQRRALVTEFFRMLRYRLLGTATAAPNDYIELGTSSEALGYLGHVDMLNRWFTNKMNTTDTRGGWGQRGEQWRFKGHAETSFWRWVASWARAARRPSDLGYPDTGFDLPPLTYHEHVVQARAEPDGTLFDLPAVGLHEERAELRRTLTERCETAAEVLADADRAVAWCHLNDEGRLLTEMIDGAVEVAGSDPTDQKEEMLAAFAAGEIRALVTKPSIAGWGLNWQHCHRMSFFPSHSYEQMYQAVRRCWRFGQTEPVTVDIVTAEGGRNVLANVQRKAVQADRMFDALVAHMRDAVAADHGPAHNQAMEVPAWASSTS